MQLPELKATKNTASDNGWPSFAKMVNEDIQKCEEYLNNPTSEDAGNALYLEITSKYHNYIPNFGDGLYGYYKNTGLYEKCSGYSLSHNLSVIKNRLIAFKNYGYKNRQMDSSKSKINIENHLTATQSQTFNVSFEDVKRQIEDMSGLSEAETKETLDKIDSIKTIVESKDPKKTKWQKIKPILVWLADKSVDVGIAVLPLLLNIGG